MTSHDAAFDARNDDLKIWLNGALVPKARAVVSVYDSGFMGTVKYLSHFWSCDDGSLGLIRE